MLTDGVRIIPLFVLFLVCHSAIAQIGLPVNSIKKDYGTPTQEGELGGYMFQRFLQNGTEITLFLADDKVVKMEVGRPDESAKQRTYSPLARHDIMHYLRANSAGQSWFRSTRKATPSTSWKRQDGRLSARYQQSTCILTIEDDEAAQCVAFQQRASVVQWSLFNGAKLPGNSAVCGFKLGFPLSCEDSNVQGMDVALFGSLSADVYGFQTSLACVGESIEGVQVSAVNVTQHSVEGAQFGVVNLVGLESRNAHVSGVQFGVFNYTRNMNGMQFGVINYIEHAPMKFLPFFNFRFSE